ncbi:MAG: PQQ-dependent sugar dehydrogenase [Anaerolineales bacterium]|nr:PQQ-dependent sugar dehydrogenase [Anaerolineales bacterium]MCB8951884.1 PQQ-dependent sugar dehydrogenase [Ardenticatenales bacterium]
MLQYALVWMTLGVTACRPASGAAAQTYASYLPITTNWQPIQLQPYTFGLYRPTTITHAGDERLFVTEKWGQIRVIGAGGSLEVTPFLDIRDRVKWDEFEQGLLGLAFAPDYATSGLFFVTYSAADGSLTLARFARSAENKNRADADGEVVLLAVPHEQPYHYGGSLAFGPDGYLYVSLGDGGATANVAQDLGTLPGKILRLDVRTVPYAIPPDNPYVDDAAARGEIWGSGLRNPWRMSFDRSDGDLFIGDVGQAGWEEVNVMPASTQAQNFGWRCYEGWQPYDLTGCAPPETFTFPIFTYPHDAAHCAITGGYRYHGSAYPPLQDVYIYSDFCGDKILGLTQDDDGDWRSAPLGPIIGPVGTSVTTFGEDSAGELYVGLYRDATIYRVTYTGVISP